MTAWDVCGSIKTPLYQPRVKELWSYGKLLLSKRPSIREDFRFTIQGVQPYTNGDNTDTRYGDMIIMIARVIPFPISLNTPQSPKGFIRAWDGTGNSTTDP